MQENLFNPDGTLAHYGVKGMKWGVIRDKGRAAGAKGKELAGKAKAELKNPSAKTRAVGTAAVAVGLLAGASFVNGKVGQRAMAKSFSEAAAAASNTRQQTILNFINDTGYRVMPTSAGLKGANAKELKKYLGFNDSQMEEYLNRFAGGAGAAYRTAGKGSKFAKGL